MHCRIYHRKTELNPDNTRESELIHAEVLAADMNLLRNANVRFLPLECHAKLYLRILIRSMLRFGYVKTVSNTTFRALKAV